MGAYTSLLDAEVLAYSIGGPLRRAWYLLRYEGDYLDGTSHPAIDHIKKSRTRLVTGNIGLRRETPLAVDDGKPTSDIILARERLIAAECNAHHNLRAEQSGRVRYKATFPEAIVAAAPKKKSLLSYLKLA